MLDLTPQAPTVVSRRRSLHQPRLRHSGAGKVVRGVPGLLVIWLAEILDRSLLAVPEVDED
jgi:hypothetical protein